MSFGVIVPAEFPSIDCSSDSVNAMRRPSEIRCRTGLTREDAISKFIRNEEIDQEAKERILFHNPKALYNL